MTDKCSETDKAETVEYSERDERIIVRCLDPD